MNAQPLNPVDIEKAFTDLLAKNGQTTSLEVKEELRARGFWATQAQVGPAVQDLADQLGVAWTFNGRYRTYTQTATTVADPNDLADTDEDEEEDDGTGASVSSAPTASLTSKTRTPPADPADREPVTNPTSGDWTVYDVHNGPQASLAFQSKLTEPQAKYAYTLKVAGAQYKDVRAKRLS